jgi:hypothetical protein
MQIRAVIPWQRNVHVIGLGGFADGGKAASQVVHERGVSVSGSSAALVARSFKIRTRAAESLVPLQIQTGDRQVGFQRSIPLIRRGPACLHRVYCVGGEARGGFRLLLKNDLDTKALKSGHLG